MRWRLIVKQKIDFLNQGEQEESFSAEDPRSSVGRSGVVSGNGALHVLPVSSTTLLADWKSRFWANS